MPVEFASLFDRPVDPTVPLMRTFSQVAETNLQRQQQKQNAQFKLADIALRRQELDLEGKKLTAATTTRELTNQLKEEQINKANRILDESNNFMRDLSAATDDEGHTLQERLNSSDAKTRDAAYAQYSRLAQQYGTSESKIVRDRLAAFEKIPSVAAKQALAVEKEKARQAEAEARGKRYEERIDQGWERLELAKKHQTWVEASKKKDPTSGGDLTLNLPKIGKTPLNQVRRMLARGGNDEAVARAAIAAITKMENYKSVPVFSESIVNDWKAQGAKLLEADKEAGDLPVKADVTGQGDILPEPGAPPVDTGEKVRVIDPNGKPGRIPKSQLDRALQMGYKLAP